MNHYPHQPANAAFRKSSYSNDQQACVEVADTPEGGRWLRDSKDTTRPAHYFTPAEWTTFVRGVRDGQFDR